MNSFRRQAKETHMPLVEETAAPRSRHALTVKAFGVTDTGRVRAANEDQFLCAELTKAMRIWQTSLPEKKVSP
jgi:PPM family protein phosphatase